MLDTTPIAAITADAVLRRVYLAAVTATGHLITLRPVDESGTGYALPYTRKHHPRSRLDVLAYRIAVDVLRVRPVDLRLVAHDYDERIAVYTAHVLLPEHESRTDLRLLDTPAALRGASVSPAGLADLFAIATFRVTRALLPEIRVPMSVGGGTGAGVVAGQLPFRT